MPLGAGRRRRAKLKKLLAIPEAREAVFLAAPDLEERIDVWLREPDSPAGRKIELALMRYASRMCCRATPFGLFAACSVGRILPETCLTVSSTVGRHTRLDMDYVVTVAAALSRDSQLQPELHFTPNSSLHRIAGRARYIEVRRDASGWSHHHCTLSMPPYLVL